MDFGDRLRQMRKAAGMTLKDLAEKAEMDPGHLSRIERGDRRLNNDTIPKICKGLGCTQAEFFSFGDGPPIHPALSELLASSDGASITDEERERLRRLPFSGEPTLTAYSYGLAMIRAEQKPPNKDRK